MEAFEVVACDVEVAGDEEYDGRDVLRELFLERIGKVLGASRIVFLLEGGERKM